MRTVLLCIISMIVVFALDMIWIGGIAKQLYADQIGMLLRKSGENLTPNWPAAILVYVFIAIGLLCFVLPKANGNYIQVLITGALFGAVIYGVYDFTNYSLLTNWPGKITIIDFIWGMTLCGVSSVMIAFIQNRFFN